MRTALRRLGYTNEDMSPHGCRAMARTLKVERLDVHPDGLEAQLAHGKSGPLDGAYGRSEFVSQGRKMMTLEADQLDEFQKTFAL